MAQSKYKEAKQVGPDALKTPQSAFERSNPQTLGMMDLQADNLIQQDRYKAAEEICRDLLETAQNASLDNDNHNVVSSLANFVGAVLNR